MYGCYKEKKIPGARRYTLLLLSSGIVNFLSLIIAGILPAFATNQLGWCNNHNVELVEPRLPSWLSWLQTPDNSLYGDDGWKNTHCVGLYTTYWGMAAWLVRNRSYGFHWTVLSAPVTENSKIISEGEPRVDKNYPENIGKTFFAQMGNYFQWKTMKKVPFMKKLVSIKIGWLLDSYVTNPDLYKTQPRALFQFSPRLGSIK